MLFQNVLDSHFSENTSGYADNDLTPAFELHLSCYVRNPAAIMQTVFVNVELSRYMPETKSNNLSPVAYLLLSCLLVIILSACNANPTSVVNYEAVPTEGDVARGEALYNSGKELAPPCSGCHIPNAPASPDLAGFGAVAATRVEGQTAHEYAFYSITEPGRFIVEGYGNAMYNMYDEALTPQDIADLIAYILRL